MVGALLVRDGTVLGEGWHDEHGGPHAEVNAIANAKGGVAGAARRSTSRWSRAAIRARRRRAPTRSSRRASRASSSASDDPSSKASGRGLGILRDEGVEVEVADGEVARRARLVNQAFRKHARTGRPWVLFKSAMTLDGKVATRTGDSQWISDESSRARAHRWRASVDAVAVGIGTALADDPALTARVEGVHHQPRHVVFDATARLPLDSQLIASGAGAAADRRRVARGAPLGHGGPGAVGRRRRRRDGRERARTRALRAGPARLVRASRRSCLEGGPKLAGAFLDAGEIDEVRLFLAPLLLGGRAARDPLEGEGVERISDALRALTLDCERVADDLLISARLREW